MTNDKQDMFEMAKSRRASEISKLSVDQLKRRYLISSEANFDWFDKCNTILGKTENGTYLYENCVSLIGDPLNSIVTMIRFKLVNRLKNTGYTVNTEAIFKDLEALYGENKIELAKSQTILTKYIKDATYFVVGKVNEAIIQVLESQKQKDNTDTVD